MTRSRHLSPNSPHEVEQSPLYLKWVEGARERGAETRRKEREAAGMMEPGELARLVRGQEAAEAMRASPWTQAEPSAEFEDICGKTKTDAQRAFEAFHIHSKWSESEQKRRDAWQAAVIKVKEWPDYERAAAVAREAFQQTKYGRMPKLGWDSIPAHVQEWWRAVVKVIRENAQPTASAGKR